MCSQRHISLMAEPFSKCICGHLYTFVSELSVDVVGLSVVAYCDGLKCLLHCKGCSCYMPLTMHSAHDRNAPNSIVNDFESAGVSISV